MAEITNYPVSLDEQTAYDAEQKAERLENTDVYVLSGKEFEATISRLLKDGRDTPSASGMDALENGLVVTKPDSPRVIFEENAVPCTLAVMFNEEGEAALLHLPLSLRLLDLGEIPNCDNETLQALDAFAKELGVDANLLITGTNVTSPLRNDVQNAISVQVASVGPEKRMEIFTPDIESSSPIRVPITKSVIYGLCFVPRTLSSDGRNKVVLVGRNNLEPPASFASYFKKENAGGILIEV